MTIEQTPQEGGQAMSNTERVLEFITNSGPSKVAVITKNLGLGETTVRKALTALVGIGDVERLDSGQYQLVTKSPEKASTPKGRRSGQRDSATAQRDEQVLQLL